MRPRIEGWTSDQEAAELARLAAGKVVLEVGSFKGFGAVLMAQAGARVWAVDWHRGDPSLGERDTLCGWWTNIRRHHVEDQVVGLVGRSETVLPALQPIFELAFLDAYHTYEATSRDVELTLPLMRPGGLLAFHDYDPRVWPGVVRAVDELRRERGAYVFEDGKRIKNLRLVGSLAVVALRAE